jgi:hypothetical protein
MRIMKKNSKVILQSAKEKLATTNKKVLYCFLVIMFIHWVSHLREDNDYKIAF